MAGDFNKLIEAGCESLGLLCNQIKSGIAQVQEQVERPIFVYGNVLAKRAVAVTADGGIICVAAMNTAPLGPTRLAAEAAARQAGKRIEVETVCVEAAKNCLAETGSTDLADQYMERWLRDMDTPVFDSMEPFVDELAKQ